MTGHIPILRDDPRHSALVPAAAAIAAGYAGAMLAVAGWIPGAALAVAVLAVVGLLIGTRTPWTLLGLVPALALAWVDRPELVLVFAAAALLTACLVVRRPEPGADPADRLRERLSRYPVLHRACFRLAACSYRGEVVAVLIDACRRVLPRARTVGCCLVAEDGGLAETASWSADGEDRRGGTDAADRYCAQATRSVTAHEEDRQVLRVPLRGADAEEANRGLLRVVLPADHENEDPPVALEVLARFGAMALANCELLSRTRALALRDGLTGLYGRYEFERRLHEQVSSARRHGRPLGLVFCDMDRLKAVNDRYGHDAGDRLLRSVAKVIADAGPPDALACRYGGEEFALLLPGRDEAEVAAAAESIVAGVRAAEAPAADAPPPTISVGWVTLREDEEAEALLARADRSCYRAKRAGRDRAETDA